MYGHQGTSRGVGGIGGGRWTGSLTTLGPSPGSQHSHWFPLRSDLPHKGQARAPVKGPITPTGFPWGMTYLTKARQVTEMSSAGYYMHLALYLVTVLTCNVKKCYMDYVLSRPIHVYPYTINLTYYYTMVLFACNYFSHQTSQLGTSDRHKDMPD